MYCKPEVQPLSIAMITSLCSAVFSAHWYPLIQWSQSSHVHDNSLKIMLLCSKGCTHEKRSTATHERFLPDHVYEVHSIRLRLHFSLIFISLSPIMLSCLGQLFWWRSFSPASHSLDMHAKSTHDSMSPWFPWWNCKYYCHDSYYD